MLRKYWLLLSSPLLGLTLQATSKKRKRFDDEAWITSKSQKGVEKDGQHVSATKEIDNDMLSWKSGSSVRNKGLQSKKSWRHNCFIKTRKYRTGDFFLHIPFFQS
jgi:hypothetical protein